MPARHVAVPTEYSVSSYTPMYYGVLRKDRSCPPPIRSLSGPSSCQSAGQANEARALMELRGRAQKPIGPSRSRVNLVAAAEGMRPAGFPVAAAFGRAHFPQLAIYPHGKPYERSLTHA